MYYFSRSHFILYSNEMKFQEIKELSQETSEGNSKCEGGPGGKSQDHIPPESIEANSQMAFDHD